MITHSKAVRSSGSNVRTRARRGASLASIAVKYRSMALAKISQSPSAMTSTMPIVNAFPVIRRPRSDPNHAKAPMFPCLQHGQRGKDIDDEGDQSCQDRDVAVGAVFEGWKLRPEFRFDGEAAPAQALDKAHEKMGGDDDEQAQHRRTQHVEGPALDVQRVNQVDADDVLARRCQISPRLRRMRAQPEAPAGSPAIHAAIGARFCSRKMMASTVSTRPTTFSINA